MLLLLAAASEPREAIEARLYALTRGFYANPAQSPPETAARWALPAVATRSSAQVQRIRVVSHAKYRLHADIYTGTAQSVVTNVNWVRILLVFSC